MTTRRGQGVGQGKGYRNLPSWLPHDKKVHRESGFGIKQPQIRMIPPVLMKPTMRKNPYVADVKRFIKEHYNGHNLEEIRLNLKNRGVPVEYVAGAVLELDKEGKFGGKPMGMEPNVGGLGDKRQKIIDEENTKQNRENKFYNIDEQFIKEKIVGGLGDNRPDSDFDPKQLKMGLKVEMEHTNDPAVAREITHDHLTEFPNYYTGLAKLEKELKQKKQHGGKKYGVFDAYGFIITAFDKKEDADKCANENRKGDFFVKPVIIEDHKKEKIRRVGGKKIHFPQSVRWYPDIKKQVEDIKKHQDEFTTSDLQGVVMVQAKQQYLRSKNQVKFDFSTMTPAQREDYWEIENEMMDYIYDYPKGSKDMYMMHL